MNRIHWCIAGQHTWECQYSRCDTPFEMNCPEHRPIAPEYKPPREFREKAGRAAERLRNED